MQTVNSYIKIFHDKVTQMTWAVEVETGGKVSFYDCRYEHTDLGQFVSSYNLETLLQREPAGLCLHGGVPAWKITTECMSRITKWLTDFRV